MGSYSSKKSGVVFWHVTLCEPLRRRQCLPHVLMCYFPSWTLLKYQYHPLCYYLVISEIMYYFYWVNSSTFPVFPSVWSQSSLKDQIILQTAISTSNTWGKFATRRHDIASAITNPSGMHDGSTATHLLHLIVPLWLVVAVVLNAEMPRGKNRYTRSDSDMSAYGADISKCNMSTKKILQKLC